MDPKKFSYFAVLSIVANRPISVDRTSNEMNALTAQLLEVERFADPIESEWRQTARERLFRRFEHLDPMSPEMQMRYGMLIEGLETVAPQDVRYFLIGWAMKTKAELGLPDEFLI